MPGADASNLIFLVSQPRAGSTLLQRILGGHPSIHTVAEPWVMLHPCFALRNKGCLAYYEAGGWAQQATRVFLGQIGGEDAYFRGIRQMGLTLYEAALAGSGKTHFLDKTPRYYWILPELERAFPDASFILLLRNPLAVLCSILRSWITNPWRDLDDFQADLLLAPRLLAQSIVRLGDKAIVTRYEDLLADPPAVVRGITDRLGLPFAPDMIAYGGRGGAMEFGDRGDIGRHDRPEAAHAERWLEDLRRPQAWRLASDYLEHLRRSDGLLPGYEHAALEQQLLQHRPGAAARLCTVSLGTFLRTGAILRRLRQFRGHSAA